MNKRFNGAVDLPSQEYLKTVLYYNETTGEFALKKSRPGTKEGRVAGCKDSDGYILIKLDYRVYKAQRLAYVFVFGSVPADMAIDHIDRNPGNNAISNLRLADPQQNTHNTIKAPANSSTGLRGVYWHKQRGCYAAAIKINRKRKYLGYFDTAEEAYSAYLAAKKAAHPFFAQSGEAL